MINDVDIDKTMDYQNNKDLKARPKPEADIRDYRKFGFSKFFLKFISRNRLISKYLNRYRAPPRM